MTDVDPTAIDIERDPRTCRMRGTAIHGDTPFNVSYISHLEGNLWSGGCADGLILPPTIVHLISLYPWERYGIGHEVRSALTVRMFDSEEQGLEQVDSIAAWVRSCADDAPTLVHCQAGLNRSGLVAARALMLARASETLPALSKPPWTSRLRLGPRVWGLSSGWLAICPWNGEDFWIQLPLVGLIVGTSHIELMLGWSPRTVNLDLRWRW